MICIPGIHPRESAPLLNELGLTSALTIYGLPGETYRIGYADEARPSGTDRPGHSHPGQTHREMDRPQPATRVPDGFTVRCSSEEHENGSCSNEHCLQRSDAMKKFSASRISNRADGAGSSADSLLVVSPSPRTLARI